MMEECLNGLSVQSEKYDNLEGLVLKGNFFLNKEGYHCELCKP